MSIALMGSIKADTLNALARRDYLAKIRCSNCGHSVKRDPAELLTKVHALRGSLHLDAAAKLLRCSECGARAAVIEPAMRDL